MSPAGAELTAVSTALDSVNCSTTEAGLNELTMQAISNQVPQGHVKLSWASACLAC